jgi:hypothetical protein
MASRHLTGHRLLIDDVLITQRPSWSQPEPACGCGQNTSDTMGPTQKRGRSVGGGAYVEIAGRFHERRMGLTGSYPGSVYRVAPSWSTVHL